MNADEGVRPETTVETLAGLRPAFAEGGTITVDPSDSRLLLPVVPPASLEPPVFTPGQPEPHHPERVLWEVRDDVITGEKRVVIDHGGVRGQGASGVGILDAYGGEVGVRGDAPATSAPAGPGPSRR